MIMKLFVGIDVGSTCAKVAVLDGGGNVVLKFLRPTGFSSVDAAEDIRERLWSSGVDVGESVVCATGYGRVSVPFANRRVTEITCHAKGAAFLFGSPDLFLIDIGGQDTKVISVENGQVRDFLMNDKCSAGTGRFLEVMANSLAIRPVELCSLASTGGGVKISSMCTVFAESEVISLIAGGERKENIAYAVVDSISDKAATLCRRIFNGSSEVFLTGGLCGCPFLLEKIGEKLGAEVKSSKDAQYAGALGAALMAMGS